MKTAFVVYCSPAGSTRHVAEVIAASLKENSVTVHTLDLGSAADPAPFVEQLQAAGEGGCLFVGSPVYRDVAVPPVMAFLNQLPPVSGLAAVPFVTWGGATSGLALWQMGQALQGKGFVLAGAAKVLGIHSMMWNDDSPVGQGHPDADDDRQIRELVDRLAQGNASSLSLDTLDGLSAEDSGEVRKKLDGPWQNVPKTIDEEKCTQCGTCVQVCPAGAVALDPLPVFGATCFDCFNCVRECPESAIASPVNFEVLHDKIRKRAEKFNEKPPTQIFV
ncbi:EFR1 family ferrodoxin [uncultured Desulfosarcina sp.]|uniref:EFR1 family ferrodoxin n=1 Tax=uncultured Desulfosarcina sp. TaxID=218289 RepID=UPI0029C99C66|nr:EFR1 family ferrodoxin [uncultured Desulfosarcina sp.]